MSKNQREKSISIDNWCRRQAIGRLLNGNDTAKKFLFGPQHKSLLGLRASSKQIIEESMGLNHQLATLIRIALDFWNGSGDAMLSNIHDLEDEEWLQFISAMAFSRSLELESIQFLMAEYLGPCQR